MKWLDFIQPDSQSEGAALSDVRDLLSDDMAEYPRVKDQLALITRIVHSPTFENTIVMIQCGTEDQLSVEQRVSVESLQVPGQATSLDTKRNLSLIEHA